MCVSKSFNKTKNESYHYRFVTDNDEDSVKDYKEREIDLNIGLLFNKSDDEIFEITMKRQVEKKFEDFAIARTDDFWLTDENKNIKRYYKEKQRERELQNIESSVNYHQERLDF